MFDETKSVSDRGWKVHLAQAKTGGGGRGGRKLFHQFGVASLCQYCCAGQGVVSDEIVTKSETVNSFKKLAPKTYIYIPLKQTILPYKWLLIQIAGFIVEINGYTLILRYSKWLVRCLLH